MPKIGGRQVEIGIGIEATAGTTVAPTIYPKWSDFSLQAVSEKEMLTSARGIRNESSNSFISRKYSEGSVEAVANVEIVPYILGLALGSVSSSVTSDTSSNVYDHTITVQNAHNSMKTATFSAKRGSVVEEEFGNCVVDACNLEVSDGYATITADVIGQFPTTGGSITPSYTEETEFAYKDMTAKFGADVSTAEGASATKLKSFSLNTDNAVQLDEAFLTGSNEVADGDLIAGNLTITGSYSLQFEDTTELDKYKNGTKEACVVEFTGGSIGDSSTETIKIDLSRLVLTSPPIENDIDGLVTLTQDFTVEYEATDAEISAVITNLDDGTNY